MHKAVPRNLWLHTVSPMYVHEDYLLSGKLLDGAYRMLKRT
jgi:hypothetical protein